MPLKILIVDDEVTLRETLTYNLEHLGYGVETAADGESAIKMVRRSQPDLIILDVMLPGLDGFEVCRILRSEVNIPIMILSARDDEIDRVIGLELGADDYISKPFSMHELLARVKAHFRTAKMIRDEVKNLKEPTNESDNLNTFGNLTIDYKRREVKINGKTIVLKPKVYDLLVFFSENQGRVFSREALIQNVWKWDFHGDNRTVDVHIRWLREKIEADPYNPIRIVTVRTVGYRFEG